MGVSGVMDTSNSNVKYHITINQNSQNVANNTSNVSVYVNFWRTNTGYSTYGSGTVYCKINGTTYSASVGVSQKITSSGIDLFSKTLDIGHNSDGTKTLATSAWISIDAPLSSSEQSYSQALTTIPRASSISSISGGTLGSSVTVNISRASSSFTHTVKYQRSDGQQFTVGTGIATSCTFTPSIDDSNYLPNATSGTAKIYVDTYSGSTWIGYASKTFTVSVPTSVIPTISSVTLSETVAGITAKFGGYVQGKSKIQGVVSASGAYSSTISAYTSTTNSQTLTTSTFTTNELVSSGSQSISTIVRDSRGRNSSATTTNYTVLAYANPNIITFTAIRANSGGVADDQGTYVLCTINASISAVNNLNDKSFKIKYKKKSDEDYTSITITPSGTTYTYNTTYLVASIDVDYEYDFRLELIDYFSTVISDKSIPTAFTLMDFNLSGKGIAFGKVSAIDGFEVEIPAVFGDTVSFDTALTIANGGTAATTAEGIRTNLELYKEYVLYSNASGSNSTITLSDSAANYVYLSIFYGQTNTHMTELKVYSPDGKNVNFSEIFKDNTAITWYGQNGAISETTLSFSLSISGYAHNTAMGYLYLDNYKFKVMRVIGYKY